MPPLLLWFAPAESPGILLTYVPTVTYYAVHTISWTENSARGYLTPHNSQRRRLSTTQRLSGAQRSALFSQFLVGGDRGRGTRSGTISVHGRETSLPLSRASPCLLIPLLKDDNSSSAVNNAISPWKIFPKRRCRMWRRTLATIFSACSWPWPSLPLPPRGSAAAGRVNYQPRVKSSWLPHIIEAGAG